MSTGVTSVGADLRAAGRLGASNPVGFRVGEGWLLGLTLLVAGCFCVSAAAGPQVTGFDRFHAESPDSEGGRLLFNELGCANCHDRSTGLPERRGPVLTNVMKRNRADWVVSFLADPHAVKPGTTMPHLVSRDEAEALTHFLAQQTGKSASFRLRPQVNAEQGSATYHQVGCVACHDPSVDFQPAEGKPDDGDWSYRSIPHPDFGAKTDLHSLAAFLRRPHETRPHGRMPDFALDDETAGNVAAYLLGFRDSNGELAPRVPAFSVDETKAETGKELFTARRCAACHDIPGSPEVEPVALQSAEGGCLSADPPAGLPDFSLTDAQRAALVAFLDGEKEATSLVSQADLSLRALNCLACHDRDGTGGPGDARRVYFTGDPSIGDTGRYPPPLTGVGAKLTSDWLARVLSGEASPVRPYLDTRMPHFGVAVDGLADELAKADGAELPGLPEGDIEAGRTLLGTVGGLNCITCHQWEGRRSLGIQALDLSDLHVRYRPEWLRHYLIDPASYRPGTLMPPFWPGGVASNQEILGGDTDRQIASIVAFAAKGEGMPGGYPDNVAGQFEIVPEDEPVVMRTFLEGVGAHAILVGFPEGVHLAYDGKGARPALLWRGRFFDAYHTWFSRHAPFEKPLGEEVVEWPEPGEGARTYRGYQFDGEGIPTFLLSFEGETLRETLRPEGEGLLRTITGPEGVVGRLPLSHPVGVRVEERESGKGERSYLYQW